MSIRGQRFELDLEGDVASSIRKAQLTSDSPTPFLGDIQERTATSEKPPQAPAQSRSQDGFPARRNRLTGSRFKLGVSQKSEPSSSAPSQNNGGSTVQAPKAAAALIDSKDQEKLQIDQENQNRLASMSHDEILEERQELMNTINPAILQALLKRSKLENGDDQSDFPGLEPNRQNAPTKTKKISKKVTFDETALTEQQNHPGVSAKGNRSDMVSRIMAADDLDDIDLKDSAQATSTAGDPPSSGSIHFPRPEQPPSLDPSSASFLEDLHQKYFPSLPADPEKLEWMKPASGKNAYSPSQTTLDAKDIRFAFKGELIPPSEAATIPVTEGLHHHGDAPDAAGYTIPELATLARSSVPSQRCIAFQTLGRILYRLGKGEFGDPSEGSSGTVGAEDTMGELARALWAEVEKERVIGICTAESEGKSMAGGRHVSAQAYATEAIWLWQKGGGRRWRTD